MQDFFSLSSQQDNDIDVRERLTSNMLIDNLLKHLKQINREQNGDEQNRTKTHQTLGRHLVSDNAEREDQV